MTKTRTTDLAFSDTTLPTIKTLAELEAEFLAIGWRGWWDASSSAYRTDVSTKCSQLTDRSGNSRHLLQATDANRPVVTANIYGTVGGVARDGLSFDGSTDIYMQAAGAFDTTTIWTVVGVCTPAAGTSAPFGSNANSFFDIDASSTTRWRSISGTGPNVDPANAFAKSVILFGYSYPGSGSATITHDINGYTATGTASAQSTNNAAFQIGSAGLSRGRKFNGTQAEWALYKGDLSLVSGAYATVKAYFAAKYRT